MIPLDSRPIVSARTLSVLVGLCTAAAYWFIPDQKELVNRLDKDGHLDRLQALAREAREDESAQAKKPLSDADRMRHWLAEASPLDRSDPDQQADKKLLCAATSTPGEVSEVLVAHADKISPELFGYLADSLARRALGMPHHQAEAGRILTEWFQRKPSWDLASRAIEAWRGGERPDGALQVLEKVIQLGLHTDKASGELDLLREKLALESGQPNLAFDIAFKRYQTADKAGRNLMLPHLVQLANQGDRTSEASHLISDYLVGIPFHGLPVEKAIAAVHAGKAFASADEENQYREYAALWSRWQEWGGHGDTAINGWLHLAVLGHQEAWERTLDLYEDVLRTDDFTLILRDRIERGLNLDQEPLLADLLAEDGDMEGALKHYLAAAERAPDPLKMLRPVARIYQQAGDWERSLSAFGHILELAPKDLEAAKGRAFALVRLKRYEDARAAYVAAATMAPQDAEVQETTAALCDSMGFGKEAREATQRLLACPGHESSPEDHIDLAEQFRFTGDSESVATALRSGLDRFPQSTRLRFSLAETLSGLNKQAEVVQLLTHESMRSNAAAMDLLIDAGTSAENGVEVTRFMGAEVPSCIAGVPETVLRLAFLFDKTGKPSAAEKIMNDLLHNPAFRQTDTWLSLGSICADYGNNQRAESFITLYLASSGSTDSDAWELLGDIYAAQDRTQEAFTAYRKAVEVLQPSAQRPATAEPAPVKVSQAAFGQ